MKLVTNRIVSPIFWEDQYIEGLTLEQKFLFLYFITNKLTTACGVYQIKLGRIALDTGMKKKDINAVLKVFEKDNRILYIDGWIAIKNFVKHQPKDKASKEKIEKLRLSLPDSLVEQLITRGWEAELFGFMEPMEKGVPMKRGVRYTEDNFNGEEYVKEMLSSKQQHIRVIAYYWQKTGIIPPSYKACRNMIARDLRDASSLVGYADEDIRAAIHWQSIHCFDLKDGKKYKWTLGTVFKNIDHFLAEYRRFIGKNK